MSERCQKCNGMHLVHSSIQELECPVLSCLPFAAQRHQGCPQPSIHNASASKLAHARPPSERRPTAFMKATHHHLLMTLISFSRQVMRMHAHKFMELTQTSPAVSCVSGCLAGFAAWMTASALDAAASAAGRFICRRCALLLPDPWRQHITPEGMLADEAVKPHRLQWRFCINTE